MLTRVGECTISSQSQAFACYSVDAEELVEKFAGRRSVILKAEENFVLTSGSVFRELRRTK